MIYINNIMNKLIAILLLVLLLCLINKYTSKPSINIKILIGNSFKNYYNLPSSPIECKYKYIKYKCYYSDDSSYYDAIIYNGNRRFPIKPKSKINIIMTTEKLSQVVFMKDISYGKNRNYQLAIDYRLFNNKFHISYPIYTDYGIDKFIALSSKNYCNSSMFIKRMGIVYIQKVSYVNRQYIVRQIMQNINVDSYGHDLNNKKWPRNISRKNKIDILKQYKFCIAIENSVITWKNGSKYHAPAINDDYVTEKLIDCLLAGSIPIYFGPKNIDLFLPNHNAIINIRDFDSISSLVTYIKHIINSSELLETYLRWHNNVSREWYNRFYYMYNFSYCKVCNFVYSNTHQRK